MCAVVSRVEICGCSAKEISYGVWKGIANKNVFASGINCFIRLAAFVKEKTPGGLLNNLCTETEYRYDICRATHGALIEHL
jgi:hypothetical protein